MKYKPFVVEASHELTRIWPLLSSNRLFTMHLKHRMRAFQGFLHSSNRISLLALVLIWLPDTTDEQVRLICLD